MTGLRGLFIVLCIILSGCSSQENLTSSSKIIKINFATDPPSLDPRKAADNISSYLATMCFDGLTRLTPQGDVELSLAKSCVISEDGLSYVFTLKEAYWSDGNQLTAYDFEKSWKSLLDPLFPSQGAFLLYPIKHAKQAKAGEVALESVGIKAIDSTTLQIELEHPSPHFFELLTCSCFYPYTDRVAIHNRACLEKKEGHFLSLGPFYIEKYKPQHTISLRKNPHYWDKDRVQLEGIEVFFVSDQNTELSMYEQGELDWVGSPCTSLPTEAMNSLKKRSDFHEYSIPGLYYYAMNTQKPPLSNANIRKALSLAINRRELSEHAIQMNMEPATRLIPMMLRTNTPLTFRDADKEKAKAYFLQGCAELGYKPNNFPKITLSYNAGIGMHFKLVQAIQQEWKETLGINTELATLEWKVYLDSLAQHDFQIARLGIYSPSLDPAFFLELFAYKNGFNNHGGWHHPSFEKLFISAVTTLDANKRLAFIQEAEELFLEEMPIIPLFFYRNSYLKKNSLHNVVLTNGQLDFKWAKIE